MSYITLKCKNCGGNMELNPQAQTATCKHCGSTFLLAELLDEHDLKFAEFANPKNLENKLLAGEQIKQGETCLYKAEYEESEKHFKKAIELDDTNFRAYLGVVKAKTHNLNVIPNNDDYKEYAKCALDFAPYEDQVLIKSELAKIELLKREMNLKRKQQRANERLLSIRKNHRRRINKFFAKVTLLISALFLALVLIGNFLLSNNNWKRLFASNIDVYSAQDFVKVLSSESNTNATINIRKDLNFDNSSVSPLGTTNKPFAGKINGNKHKLSNLNISVNDSGLNNSYGIFTALENANINNLVLDNIKINYTTSSSSPVSNNFGILAGEAKNSTIKNIEIKNTCSIIINCEQFVKMNIGGLFGYTAGSTSIKNISSNAEINVDLIARGSSNTACIGGITGKLEDSTISAAFSESKIETTISNNSSSKANLFLAGNAGLLERTNNTSKNITECFFAGKISTNCTNTNQSIGGIVASGAALSESASNYCYFASSNYFKNTNYIQKQDFADYSQNEKFTGFIDNPNVYKQKILDTFSSKTWSYETFKPTLKD